MQDGPDGKLNGIVGAPVDSQLGPCSSSSLSGTAYGRW
jgi:hypothetical protein